jgi:hypothetical protein
MSPAPAWTLRRERVLVDDVEVWVGEPARLGDGVVFDAPVPRGVHLVEVEVDAEEAFVDSRTPEQRIVRRSAAVRVTGDAVAELAVEARGSASGYELRFDFR